MKERIKSRKGFTLIELLTVVAILGILVLIATPKFFGYINKATIAGIESDIKSYEVDIASKEIESDDISKDWNNVDIGAAEGNLYSTKGKIGKQEIKENLVLINDKDLDVKSNLKGSFLYANSGSVYYYDGNIENIKEIDAYKADDVYKWVPYILGYEVPSQSEPGYYMYIGSGIENVEIPNTINGDKITSYYRMFANSPSDLKIVISKNKEVTNMSEMFSYSQSEDLDVSRIDTSNVLSMDNMFQGAKSKNLDISNWNTSNVKNMRYMFYSGEQETIDVHGLTNENLESVEYMFKYSTASKINLKDFDTSNVSVFKNMFENMSSTMVGLDVSGFNTKNAQDMASMFSRTTFDNLDLSGFNTSKVKNFNAIFYKTTINSLDLSSFTFKDGAILDSFLYSLTLKNSTEVNFVKGDLTRLNNINNLLNYSNVTKLNVWTQENIDFLQAKYPAAANTFTKN